MMFSSVCSKCEVRFKGPKGTCNKCTVVRKKFKKPQTATCAIEACGKYLTRSSDMCLDHIIPIAWGGSDTVDNIQILCVSCHKNKTRREGFYLR